MAAALLKRPDLRQSCPGAWMQLLDTFVNSYSALGGCSRQHAASGASLGEGLAGRPPYVYRRPLYR
eukprot:1313285-Amphidinium_carterae.1